MPELKSAVAVSDKGFARHWRQTKAVFEPKLNRYGPIMPQKQIMPVITNFNIRDRLGLALLLGIAAALRAYAWMQTTVLFNDGPIFLGLAEAMIEGRWSEVLAHPFHPLYPALIALVAQAPIELESAAIIVSIAGGLMSILGIFLFVHDAFGRETAWLAACLVAAHPSAVDFSSDIMSDGLYSGFYLLGFAALFRLIKTPDSRLALSCGVLAGLAYLVRPEGVGLLLAAALLLAGRSLTDSDLHRTLSLSAAGLFLAATLVMSPFVISLGIQTGEFRLSQKKSVSSLVTGHPETGLAPAALETTIPLPRSSEKAQGGGPQRPPRTLVGALQAVMRMTRTSLASLRYEVALFVAFGLFSVFRNRRHFQILREATVWLTALLYSGVLVLLVWGAGYISRRHALPALLPLIGYAAIGWQQLYQRALGALFGSTRLKQENRFKTQRIVCTSLAIVLCFSWGARDLRPRRTDRAASRLAAEWLRSHDQTHAPVAAQKLRIAYYADAAFIPLPSGTNFAIEAHLRTNHARWIIIDARHIENHLGLAGGIGRWLKPVHTIQSNGQRALVLEISPKPPT